MANETTTDLTTDVQPGASSTPSPVISPAIKAAVASDDFSKFSEARHARNRKPATDTTTIADPSPAKPAEQAASPDVKPDKAAVAEKPKKGVQARTAELDTEIAGLNERLKLRAQLRRELAEPIKSHTDVKPADSSAAKPVAVPGFPSFAEYLEQHPEIAEHKDPLQVWLDARDDDRSRRSSQEAERQASFKAMSDADNERATKFAERMAARITADPDFLEKHASVTGIHTVEAVQAYNATAPSPELRVPVTPANIVATEIMGSEVGDKLIEHLSLHPEDLTRLVTVPDHLRALPPGPRARAHVAFMQRELGKLEAKFTTGGEPSHSPKLVSSAPAPARTLGTQASEPTSPLRGAVSAGRFEAYEAARFAGHRL